ncbi:hypothetical protein BIW12_09210 [Flavobacterium commune]|uniref:Uncharacterized protein n=1 Tax=Flavobacterium commune TaxID=1306519 RepID=A0A1D9PEC2_9FLAO|nr:hypothetical protein BIW12_09210 [Flavobacterium commune]
METGFLFDKTGFWKGVGSIFSLYGDYYEFNSSRTAEEADQKALQSDWENVGEDLRTAERQFKEKHSKELCLK